MNDNFVDSSQYTFRCLLPDTIWAFVIFVGVQCSARQWQKQRKLARKFFVVEENLSLQIPTADNSSYNIQANNYNHNKVHNSKNHNNSQNNNHNNHQNNNNTCSNNKKSDGIYSCFENINRNSCSRKVLFILFSSLVIFRLLSSHYKLPSNWLMTEETWQLFAEMDPYLSIDVNRFPVIAAVPGMLWARRMMLSGLRTVFLAKYIYVTEYKQNAPSQRKWD